MKLLHINSYFSTTALYRHLYERQTASGLDIDVYVPIAEQFPQAQLNTSGDYTKVTRPYQQRDRFLFPVKHRKIWKDLQQQYRLASYDLIHAHSLFSNGWLARQVNRRFGTPYVVAVRSADLVTFFQKMPWMRKTGLDILQHAAHIVFISQNTYQRVYDRYIPKDQQASLKAKTSVIANGIDDFWHQHRYLDEAKTVQYPLQIVSTGQVCGRKRFVQLAEMVQAYNDNIRPAELHIIGPNRNPKIVSILENFPLVHYYGPKTPQEMADIYRRMDLFALLSYPETFGLVYAEAMSQGLPVIYTQGQGFDGYFPNYQVGVAVDKTDQIAFSNAIDYLCDHYQEVSTNAVTASKQFNWDQVHQQCLDLYATVIS